MSQTLVAIDLETTGLNPDRDAIIEIGAAKFRGQEVLDTFATLVNPKRDLPTKITHITGIKPEQLVDAPSLFSVARALTEFVGDCPVIGHNVTFDLRFLNNQGLLVRQSYLDTFELASILMPEASRLSLAALTDDLDIEMENHHRALDDAQATRELYLSLYDKAMALSPSTLREINRLAAETDWVLRGFFLQIEREQARTAFTSQRPTSASQGDGYLPTVFSRAKDKALEPTQDRQPIDAEQIADLLQEGGLFNHHFSGYEYRPQQIDMLNAVGETFNMGGQLLVEAGTGTGKSMAYLLPAIYFAHQNRERVVISTNTINLQDQLFNKDIPDLARILPLDFKVALLKGRSNYICWRRLANFRRRGDLSTDELRVLAKILVWLPATETGDRAELMLLNHEQSIWSNVHAEAETCLGDRCRYRESGQCYLYRARERAESAHLIIVNHALMLSDMVTDNRVLPEYEHLVVDEAHHLEDRATDHLGFSVSQAAGQRMLNELSYERSGGSYTGFLSEILPHFTRAKISDDDRDKLILHIKRLHNDVERSRRSIDMLFNELSMFLDNYCESRSRNFNVYDLQVRLTTSVRSQPDWGEIEMMWEDVSGPLARLAQGLEQLRSTLEHFQDVEVDDYEGLMQDMQGYATRVQELDRGLESILTHPVDDGIYWAQVSVQHGTVTLNMAPLHVAPLLREQLFLKKDTVILTSATLCSDGDFSYIRQRLGLADAEELQVGSPFDYPNSTLLYLPTDIPEPGQQNYQRTVEQAVYHLCVATQGRTLVLFTSYSQLRNTYQSVVHDLERENIVIYAQGIDGSRRQILENFRTTPRSVLFGTRSFWEGVDVVGDALSCLVIARLPFAVPSDPVVAARSETFDEPFGQYTVPEAILRFRQGFGRLIRSKTDRGVVIVLDKRVQSKFYGNRFVTSLPECTLVRRPLRQMPRLAAHWLEHGPTKKR